MDSEQETIDLRVQRLETVVTAARAVVMHGQPNWERRCHAAANAPVSIGNA